MDKYIVMARGGENMESDKFRSGKHVDKLISIEFVCHGNILKIPGKARKINGFTAGNGAYYTTTTPFGFRSES